MNYATFEGFPCIYTDSKAWVLYDEADGWRPMRLIEIKQTARVLDKDEFEELFPDLPALPD